jgi:hypothetical protein
MMAIATVRRRSMGLSLVVLGSRMPMGRLRRCWIVSMLTQYGDVLIARLLTVANNVRLLFGVGGLILIVSEWRRVLGSRFNWIVLDIMSIVEALCKAVTGLFFIGRVDVIIGNVAGVVKALCETALILIIAERWRIWSRANAVVVDEIGIVEALRKARAIVFLFSRVHVIVCDINGCSRSALPGCLDIGRNRRVEGPKRS